MKNTTKIILLLFVCSFTPAFGDYYTMIDANQYKDQPDLYVRDCVDANRDTDRAQEFCENSAPQVAAEEEAAPLAAVSGPAAEPVLTAEESTSTESSQE